MYNDSMKIVTIEGPEQAIRAGTWAEENIKSEWELDLVEPFSKTPKYAFIFSNTKEAMHFALKWS